MQMLIYFHGFGSNAGPGSTAEWLGRVFEGSGYGLFGAPSYNTTDADLAINTLEPIVKDLSGDNDVLLVGSSLGGFFANYFSNKYALPVVLINPSLDPLVSLQKYCSGVNLESFAKYYTDDTNGVPKAVVLGKLDDVIPYRSFMNRFESRYKIFINEDMGHRLEKLEHVMPAIQFMINNIAL